MYKYKIIISIILLSLFTETKAQYLGGVQDGYAKAFPSVIPDPCVIILPIELIEFSGIDYGNQNVKLSWKTATEINNDRFEIYHSIDGVTWSLLEKVKGAGNSSIIQNYTYYHNNTNPHINYYKLKQVDFNGGTANSSIIAVHVKSKIDLISIYPNPSNDFIKIDGIQTNFNWVIYNLHGIEIKNGFGEINQPIIVTELSEGLYFIQLMLSNQIIYKKMQITR